MPLDLTVKQLRQLLILAVDQSVERDLDVPVDRLDLVPALAGHFGQECLKSLLQEVLLDSSLAKEGGIIGDARPGGRWHEAIEEDGRLADARSAGCAGLDDEEPPVESVTPAVLDRGREGIEPGGAFALQIEEDGPAAQVIGCAVQDVFAHDLEKRVAGRDPFQGWVRGQQCLVECNPRIVCPESAEARLQSLADGDQAAWQLAHAIDVQALGDCLRLNASDRGRLYEEILDHLRHQPPLAGLNRFADDRGEVQLLFGQAL